MDSLKVLRKTLLCLKIGGVFLFFAICLNSAAFAAGTADSDVKKATLILKNQTIEEAQSIRRLIEESGGRVLVFQPPNILRIKAGASIAGVLEKHPLVKELLFDADAGEEVSPVNIKSAQIVDSGFAGDDVMLPQYRRMPKNQMQAYAKRYYRRWQKNQDNIKRKFIERQGLVYSPAEVEQDLKAGSVTRGVTPEGKPETSGKAGASYYETSLYLAGDIAVGVFFEPGFLPQWTKAAADLAYSRITKALEILAEDFPDANITFTFVKEMEADGTFLPCPSEIMAQMDYVNDLRSVYNTHWSFMIDVVNGGQRAHAWLWGPSMEIYDHDINVDGGTIRHETCHIFGAYDQYTDSKVKPPPTSRYGYLNVVNANSRYNNGAGYFDGAGEKQQDIMIGTQRIYGVYTKGQMGIWDSDGDGVIDPLDTYAKTSLNQPVLLNGAQGGKRIKFTGKAVDMPLINEKGDYFIGDVTLNTVKSVEYRINGSRWIAALALDGSFDSKEEEFGFISPELPEGEYLFEARAINSAGNAEVYFAAKKVVIDSALPDNAAAVVDFCVTPETGSTKTVFKFDASKSIHLKDGAALQVRWDFDNDGAADTPWLSANKIYEQVFYGAGKKVIRLEARDKNGRVFAVIKELTVQGANIAPKAYFTAAPAHFHGSYTGGYPVRFSAEGTFDAEDEADKLLARWRFEEGGEWTEWENLQTAKIINYIYVLGEKSKLWRVALEVKDSDGAVSRTARDVWAVPYNTQPYLTGFDGDICGGELVLSNYNAMDQDSITTWDGLLEYRWDFESDGIWDTKYSALKEAIRFELPKDKDTIRVACEARDRFGAASKMSKLFFINETGAYIAPVPAQRIDRGEHLLLTIKAVGREDDEIELDVKLFNNDGEDTFLDSGQVTLVGNVPGTLDFNWTPFKTGVYTARISAKVNGKPSDAKEEFTITVVDANNKAPVIDYIGGLPVEEGKPVVFEATESKLIRFEVEAYDPEQEGVRIFAFGVPQGASFEYDEETAKGVFQWLPPENYTGKNPAAVIFRAADSYGIKSEVSVCIKVAPIEPPPNRPPVVILRDLNNPTGDPADEVGNGLNGKRVYNNTALKLKDGKVMLWIRMEDDRPFVKKVFLPFCRGAKELTLKYLGGGWNGSKGLWCGEWTLSGEITKTASFTVSVTDGEFITPPVWLYFPAPGEDRDPKVIVTAQTPLKDLLPGANIKITVSISDDNVVPGDAIFLDRQTKIKMARLRLTHRLVIKEDTFKTWEIYSLPGGVPEGLDKSARYILYFGARDLRSPEPRVHGEAEITLK